MRSRSPQSARPKGLGRAQLLVRYLSEPDWPALDSWFARQIKAGVGVSPADQLRLWQAITEFFRSALARFPAGLTPEQRRQWSAGQLSTAEVKAALKRLLRQTAAQTDRPEPLEAFVPPWLWPAMRDRLGRSWPQAAQAAAYWNSQEGRPPLYIRAKRPEDGAAVEAELMAEGYEVKAKNGYCSVGGSKSLFLSRPYQTGRVEIQDAGSQLLGASLPVKPGQRLWDVCAGRGGKTLQLASRLQGKGVLVATDIFEHKLAVLRQRVKRADFQMVRTKLWQGDQLPDFGREVAATGFDGVFLDAPCSGSGTWRSDPEGPFRLTPAKLAELTGLQKQLLGLSWQALKPGGILVYGTCSWIPAENEQVVEEFLGKTSAVLLQQGMLGPPDLDSQSFFHAVLQKPL